MISSAVCSDMYLQAVVFRTNFFSTRCLCSLLRKSFAQTLLVLKKKPPYQQMSLHSIRANFFSAVALRKKNPWQMSLRNKKPHQSHITPPPKMAITQPQPYNFLLHDGFWPLLSQKSCQKNSHQTKILARTRCSILVRTICSIGLGIVSISGSDDLIKVFKACFSSLLLQ